LDIVRKENFYEIFFGPPVCSEGVYLFHSRYHIIFFLTN
jgi:hypothetical protein